MGLFWLVMGHVFHMISYVDCDVDCDMDSYMPGGGGMLTTDIEASRWSNVCVLMGLGVYQCLSQHNIITSHFFPFISTAPKVIYPVYLAPFWPPYGGFPSHESTPSHHPLMDSSMKSSSYCQLLGYPPIYDMDMEWNIQP